jgi:hypothetical protein
MADDDARKQLLDLLDKKVFDPVLNAPPDRYKTDEDKEKLKKDEFEMLADQLGVKLHLSEVVQMALHDGQAVPAGAYPENDVLRPSSPATLRLARLAGLALLAGAGPVSGAALWRRRRPEQLSQPMAHV